MLLLALILKCGNLGELQSSVRCQSAIKSSVMVYVTPSCAEAFSVIVRVYSFTTYVVLLLAKAISWVMGTGMMLAKHTSKCPRSRMRAQKPRGWDVMRPMARADYIRKARATANSVLLSNLSAASITERIISIGLDAPLAAVVFIQAVKCGDHKTVEILLNEGVNPNLALSRCHSTMLLLAVQSGCLDTVRALLEYGADPELFDHRKRSPLGQSVCRRRWDMAALLLKYGAVPESVDNAFPGFNEWASAGNSAIWNRLLTRSALVSHINFKVPAPLDCAEWTMDDAFEEALLTRFPESDNMYINRQRSCN